MKTILNKKMKLFKRRDSNLNVKASNFLKLLFAIAITCSIFPACKKLVNIPPPTSQLVTISVFNDNQALIAAQLGVYIQIRTTPSYIDRATGLSSDELFPYATDIATKNVFLNGITVDDAGASTLSVTWGIYNYIYSENAILEGLANNKVISSVVSKQTRGEAYFTRAYLYFNLVNMFGDVPLVTTTDYKANAVLARAPARQVYQQIITDLNLAKSMLSSKYLNETDSVVVADRVRPTTWSASALLARTYLYMGAGYYDKAEAEATTVINNTSLFNLPTDLNTVFKKNSLEAIWQLMPSSNDVNVLEGVTFVVTGTPSGSGSAGNSTVSASLLNAFESNDKRKINWINSYINSTGSYFFANKYKRGSNATGISDEYSMVLRLAEQYLIRAEARAQQNNLSGALSDINVIRSRAGLASLPIGLTQDQILAAIAQERRVELFTEGDRWFNLKRTQTVDAVMGAPGNATATKGGIWKSYQQWYPIPLRNIQLDPNLVQNTGY